MLTAATKMYRHCEVPQIELPFASVWVLATMAMHRKETAVVHDLLLHHLAGLTASISCFRDNSFMLWLSGCANVIEDNFVHARAIHLLLVS